MNNHNLFFKKFCILAFKEKHFPWTFKYYRHTDRLPATAFSIVSYHHILIIYFFGYIWKDKKI